MLIKIFLNRKVLICFFISLLYSNAYASLPRLSVKNKLFIDPQGRTVILHGLNEMNKKPPFYPAAIGFDQRNIHFIKHYGFNAVRLGVFWSAIEPSPGKYDLSYLGAIKKTILALNKADIYTLIDFHQDGYSEKSNGLGFPDWATLIEGNSYLENIGFPLSLFCDKTQPMTMPTCLNWDYFWNNAHTPTGIPLQESYARMLSFTIKFLKSVPGIIGYDLMNEPFPGSAWINCRKSVVDFGKGCYHFDLEILTPFYQKLIRTVHRADESKIIFYEPLSLYGIGAPTFIDKIQTIDKSDNPLQLGFSYHNYYNENLSLAFKHAKKQEKINHVVPLMTEFGASTVTPLQLKHITELADEYHTSWMEWAYTNNPVFKISHIPGMESDGRDQGIVYDATKPLSGENVRFDRLHAISRAYPQIVSGQIIKFRYDANLGTVYLRFKTKAANHKNISTNPVSTLFIPNFNFPNGYTVSISGAKIIPSQNTQYLNIKNLPGESEVTVSIKRKKTQSTS